LETAVIFDKFFTDQSLLAIPSVVRYDN